MTRCEELKQVICDVCHNEKVIKNKNENYIEKGNGPFHYYFTKHGIDFNGKSQPKEFSNLKLHIMNYLSSKKAYFK